MWPVVAYLAHVAPWVSACPALVLVSTTQRSQRSAALHLLNSTACAPQMAPGIALPVVESCQSVTASPPAAGTMARSGTARVSRENTICPSSVHVTPRLSMALEVSDTGSPPA